MARTAGPAAVSVRGRSAVVRSAVQQQPAGPEPAGRQAGAVAGQHLPALVRFRVLQGRRQRHGVQRLQQATAVTVMNTGRHDRTLYSVHSYYDDGSVAVRIVESVFRLLNFFPTTPFLLTTPFLITPYGFFSLVLFLRSRLLFPVNTSRIIIMG